MKICATVALLVGLALRWSSLDASAASPAPPDLMSYQGYLVDVNGAALAPTSPANYSIVFRIYDASAGGNVLWSEQQIVTVDKGNFSVVLGEGTAVSGEARPVLSSVFSGATASDRYLGIAVTISGTTMTISPRLRLLSSAYAFAATAASKLISNSGQTLLTLANGKLEGTSELTLNPGPLTVTGNATVSGNVGIGTTSPGARLEVNAASSSSSSPAFKLELSGANLLAYKAGASSTTLENTGGGSLNLQTQGGNVGIGTASPGMPLDVNGHARFGTTGQQIAFEVQSGFTRTAFNQLRFWDWDGGGDMVTFNNGNVGIGTSTPSAKLHLAGGMKIDGNNFLSFGTGIAGKQGNAGDIGYEVFGAGRLHIVGAGTDASTRRVRIWDRVESSGFDTVSDARTKEIVQRSDSQHDLETVRGLHVTDYRFVDGTAGGNVIRKGFIAQEVAGSIPEAVTAGPGFVPDIYSSPATFDYDAGQKAMSVSLVKPHGLKTGDRVRILADDSIKDSTVAAVLSAQDFVIGNIEKCPRKVLVYGREVSDFRTLDYDQIFTTGISAIQELDRQVQSLKQSESRIAELEQKTARIAELEAKASRVDALEKRVRELEGVEQQVAELRKLVAELALATARKASEPVAAARPQRGHGD